MLDTDLMCLRILVHPDLPSCAVAKLARQVKSLLFQ
jgi:hypothetical protein